MPEKLFVVIRNFRFKMMSKKQWFVLLCIFWLYLLLGASIFFYVESQEELRKQFQDLEEKQIIGGELFFNIPIYGIFIIPLILRTTTNIQDSRSQRRIVTDEAVCFSN